MSWSTIKYTSCCNWERNNTSTACGKHDSKFCACMRLHFCAMYVLVCVHSVQFFNYVGSIVFTCFKFEASFLISPPELSPAEHVKLFCFLSFQTLKLNDSLFFTAFVLCMLDNLTSFYESLEPCVITTQAMNSSSSVWKNVFKRYECDDMIWGSNPPKCIINELYVGNLMKSYYYSCCLFWHSVKLDWKNYKAFENSNWINKLLCT